MKPCSLDFFFLLFLQPNIPASSFFPWKIQFWKSMCFFGCYCSEGCQEEEDEVFDYDTIFKVYKKVGICGLVLYYVYDMSLVDITLRHNAQRSLLLFVKFYSTNLYGGDQNQPAITYCEGRRTRAFIQCIINKFFFFFLIYGQCKEDNKFRQKAMIRLSAWLWESCSF